MAVELGEQIRDEHVGRYDTDIQRDRREVADGGRRVAGLRLLVVWDGAPVGVVALRGAISAPSFLSRSRHKSDP
jgi:hypothetical protein